MKGKKTIKKAVKRHKFPLRFDDKIVFDAVSKAAIDHKDSINKYLNRIIADNPAIKKAISELSNKPK